MVKLGLVLLVASGLTGCEATRAMLQGPAVVEDDAAVPIASVVPSAEPPTWFVADAGPIRDGGSKAVKTPVDAGPPLTSKKLTKQPPIDGLPAGAACEGGDAGGCASGSTCRNGTCACVAGWTACAGSCRDLARDPYNCDRCGHECTYGEYCKWGHCER